MSQTCKERPRTFDEVVEAAYKAPSHIVQILTPRGKVEVRLTNRSGKKKWVEGLDYTIEGGTKKHPADAFKLALKELKAADATEGKESDLSLRKNKYLYGTSEKEGIIK